MVFISMRGVTLGHKKARKPFLVSLPVAPINEALIGLYSSVSVTRDL